MSCDAQIAFCAGVYAACGRQVSASVHVECAIHDRFVTLPKLPGVHSMVYMSRSQLETSDSRPVAVEVVHFRLIRTPFFPCRHIYYKVEDVVASEEWGEMKCLLLLPSLATMLSLSSLTSVTAASLSCREVVMLDLAVGGTGTSSALNRSVCTFEVRCIALAAVDAHRVR